MTKLTKTQQALIDSAKARGGFFSIESGSGRGAKGGRVSYGSRERAAVHKLAELGLVEITNSVRDVDYTRSYSIWSTVVSFRVLHA